jgi:hypothetical protein
MHRSLQGKSKAAYGRAACIPQLRCRQAYRVQGIRLWIFSCVFSYEPDRYRHAPATEQGGGEGGFGVGGCCGEEAVAPAIADLADWMIPVTAALAPPKLVTTSAGFETPFPRTTSAAACPTVLDLTLESLSRSIQLQEKRLPRLGL